MQYAADMQFAQSVEHADSHRQCLTQRQGTALQPRFQRNAVDIGPHQIRTFAVTAHVEQRRLLRAVQLPQLAALLLQPHADTLRNRRVRQGLDNDGCALLQVVGQQGLRAVAIFQNADGLVATAEEPFCADRCVRKGHCRVIAVVRRYHRRPRPFSGDIRPAGVVRRGLLSAAGNPVRGAEMHPRPEGQNACLVPRRSAIWPFRG